MDFIRPTQFMIAGSFKYTCKDSFMYTCDMAHSCKHVTCLIHFRPTQSLFAFPLKRLVATFSRIRLIITRYKNTLIGQCVKVLYCLRLNPFPTDQNLRSGRNDLYHLDTSPQRTHRWGWPLHWWYSSLRDGEGQTVKIHGIWKQFNSLLHHVSSPIVFRFRKHVKTGHIYPSGHTTVVAVVLCHSDNWAGDRIPSPLFARALSFICLALFVLHGCQSIFALCGCTSARSTRVFICALLVWLVRRMSSCGYQIFSPWANPSFV